MALGASARDVIRLVLRQGGTQLVFGLGIGLLMALGLTQVIGSLVPSRRATRTQPVSALRSE